MEKTMLRSVTNNSCGLLLLLPGLLLLLVTFYAPKTSVHALVPVGICADGSPACQVYKSSMCPTKGTVKKEFETYAYCCCRKTCMLCDRESVEQRVESRFQKAEDKSSYDWSGQRWHFGDGWHDMNSYSGRWGNPFVRASNEDRSGEVFTTREDDDYY